MADGDLLDLQGSLPDHLANTGLKSTEFAEEEPSARQSGGRPVVERFERVEDGVETGPKILDEVVVVEGDAVAGVVGAANPPTSTAPGTSSWSRAAQSTINRPRSSSKRQ